MKLTRETTSIGEAGTLHGRPPTDAGHVARGIGEVWPEQEASSSWERTLRESVSHAPRVLGDTGAKTNGPVLVCVGGLHGNEPCGVVALQRILAQLAQDASGLKGRLIGLAGNRAALTAGERYLDEDLNRIWWGDGTDGSSSQAQPNWRELEEMRGLKRELEVLSSLPRKRAFLVDLHSTSGGGSAFTSLDDTLENRSLAFEIPVPHVLGLEEELAGTLVGWLNEQGFTAIGFEAGQHVEPASVDRAEAAVWIAMEAAGVLARGERAEVAQARSFLEEQFSDFPNVVEVLYRHPVQPTDEFRMLPGYENFDTVEHGQLLARTRTGELHAPLGGMILMPLYQDQGEDGFFVVCPVKYAWLKVSAVLRRMRADLFLHWLPGVQRSSDRPEAYVVNLHRARLKALQIFHLLGYKKIARTEDSLIMSRRDAKRD